MMACTFPALLLCRIRIANPLVGVEPFHLLSAERRSRKHQPRQNRKHYGCSRATHRHLRIGKFVGCHFCVHTLDASAPQGK